MISGRIVGRGIAYTAAGGPTPYQIVIPDKTLANLAALAAEARRWRAVLTEFTLLAEAARLDWLVVRRAKFTEEVLATVGENVRLGACCQLLVQDLGGRVLGVATYAVWQGYRDGQMLVEGGINLQAIDPRHLAGTPGTEQLRGIGTAMVAAISRQLLARGVVAVYLHPLDAAAAEFWTRRGFGPCGRGGLMCVRGRPAIESLIDGCTLAPDGAGDVVICGRPGDTAAQRIPALAPVSA